MTTFQPSISDERMSHVGALRYFGFSHSKEFNDLTPSMKRKKMREFSLFVLSECSKLKGVL